MPTVLTLGSTITRAGCMTRLDNVVGRGPADLERAIGYKLGRLAGGFYVLLLKDALKAGDVEFFGYTHFSGGKVGKPSNDPAVDAGRAPVQARLAADVGTAGVAALAERFTTGLADQGAGRLVKITPMNDEADPANKGDEYPVGAGIPQWNLRTGLAKSFYVAAEVHGSVWSLANGARIDVSHVDYRRANDAQPAAQVRTYLSEVICP